MKRTPRDEGVGNSDADLYGAGRPPARQMRSTSLWLRAPRWSKKSEQADALNPFQGGRLASVDEFRIGRESMRLFALALAAVIAAAAPAQAAWKAQKYPQYGFGVDFPAEPKMSKGEYRGVIAGRMPTTVIGAEEDGTIYQVVIVDFKNRLAETTVLLEEAIFLATQEGKLVSDVTARTDNGAKFAKYGRRVTVMTKDGGKKTTELYLVNGLLLMFEGVITPK